MSEEAWERVERFKIYERIESDYMPLVVELEGNEESNTSKGEDKNEEKLERNIWSSKGIWNYRYRTEEGTHVAQEVNNKWKELRDTISRAVEKREMSRNISNKFIYRCKNIIYSYR